VTLVDRDNHHLFQPLLYQVATGILSEGEIAPPIRSVLHRQHNAEVELAAVKGFDLGRILGAFEMAELEGDPEKQAEWLTFVVVGGGPTGVEIAGQIAELSRRVLKHDFRVINPGNARILLFDGGEKVLATFGDRLSGKAAKELERLGIELHMSSIVTGVDQAGVIVKSGEEERRFAARTKIWAAGVQASPLARLLGEATAADVDRAGRVSVLPDCTLPGHPEVFAIGDMMSLDELPGVAEVAMQQGLHASNTIIRRLEGKQSKPFRYRDLGSMAMIARFSAVVSFKGLRLSGFIGWMAWLFVHLAFLTGFKNRLATIPRWAFTFIGNGRPQRTVTLQQVVARVAIEEAGGEPFLRSVTSGEEQPRSSETKTQQ
jgi:NADH dehydrogenase